MPIALCSWLNATMCESPVAATPMSLLVGFDTWGIVAMVKKSIGMLAFALWNKQNLFLTLCLDHFGQAMVSPVW